MSESPIVVEHVNHAYGEGDLRREVLHDVTGEVRPGEIVILTGPSGSGKTTLLTLIGALRSTQEGSLRVLGRQLRGAPESTLADVRRRIGYVFQAHNLLDSLTILQNVQMSLELHADLPAHEVGRRAAAALQAVGLGERLDAHPSELSGGQRQRVAIARAIAARPDIILADEPTASLDKRTGRAVVELLESLARKDGVTVVLVTHDSRILDIADRVLALEDGRLSSLLSSVASDTHRMVRTLARDIRNGELAARLAALDQEGFAGLLEEVTAETRDFIEVMEVAQTQTFQSMLEQVVGAFTSKLREVLGAEHVGLHFLDPDAQELWSLDTCEHGSVQEIRVPASRGLESEAADAGPAPSFSVPVADSEGRPFALVEVAGREGRPFDAADREAVVAFNRPLGLLLESWWRMGCACRARGVGSPPSCCGAGECSP
jgi:putative ABC transport system ATP-binding protein